MLALSKLPSDALGREQDSHLPFPSKVRLERIRLSPIFYLRIPTSIIGVIVQVFGVKKIPDLRFVRAGQWGTYGGGRLIEVTIFSTEAASYYLVRYSIVVA